MVLHGHGRFRASRSGHAGTSLRTLVACIMLDRPSCRAVGYLRRRSAPCRRLLSGVPARHAGGGYRASARSLPLPDDGPLEGFP
jgi:hypothetical protein